MDDIAIVNVPKGCEIFENTYPLLCVTFPEEGPPSLKSFGWRRILPYKKLFSPAKLS